MFIKNYGLFNLVLMLYYFLSICLVIFIFHKLLFFMLSLHTLENQVMLYFLSVIISVIFPLWHCYYLDQVMLRQTLALKNRQLSNLSLEPKGFSCPWFPKVSLIEAFITTHNCDIICLSETFLDSAVSQHDENIMING